MVGDITVYSPISSIFENTNGFSAEGPDLTPLLEATPVPKRNRPGTTKPSNVIKEQESTFPPWSLQYTSKVYRDVIFVPNGDRHVELTLPSSLGIQQEMRCIRVSTAVRYSGNGVPSETIQAENPRCVSINDASQSINAAGLLQVLEIVRSLVSFVIWRETYRQSTKDFFLKACFVRNQGVLSTCYQLLCGFDVRSQISRR
jgi:hypothetical protein